MHGPCCAHLSQRHLAGGSRRPQSLIKCLIVSCGASVWDWDMGTISQMDTCDLLPLPKPYWTQLSRRLRSHQTPKPSVTWEPGEPLCPFLQPHQHHPSQNIWEALAGTCASHPGTLICVDSDCVATPCLCVRAFCNPFPWVSACPVPSQLPCLPVHLFLASKLPELGLRLQTPFLQPLLAWGSPVLWQWPMVCACVYICICDTLGSVSCILLPCPKKADGWRSHSLVLDS